MSKLIKAHIAIRHRLVKLADERGALSVEMAMLIGLGVTLALLLIGVVTGAFDRYSSKIK